MNCDQVFNALTRGPFPTGNDALDERVERHLERCGSCQRLAAALQPAVELFEEAVAPEESCRLPAYWGDLFNQSDATPSTRTRAPKLLRHAKAASANHRPAGWGWEHAWRIAAALLLGMALGGVMRAALQKGDASTATLAAHDDSRSRRSDSRGQHLRMAAFDGQRMTAACGPLAMVLTPAPVSADEAAFSNSSAAPPKISSPTPVASADAPGESAIAGWNNLAKQKCCTECHHAGGGGATIAQPARVHVANSCALCHDNSAATRLAVPQGGE